MAQYKHIFPQKHQIKIIFNLSIKISSSRIALFRKKTLRYSFSCKVEFCIKLFSSRVFQDLILHFLQSRRLESATLPPLEEDRNITTPAPSSCKSDEFFCVEDKLCIPAIKKCDFREDCPDKSDEKECGK